MTPREQQLWAQYHRSRSTADRNAIVLMHLSLARRIALQYQHKCRNAIAYQELVSDCLLGLIIAVEKFRFGQGAKFSTFAAQKIRYTMLDNVRERDVVSRQRRYRSMQIYSAEAEIYAKLGRPPTENEICQHLGITARTWQAWRQSRNSAPRYFGLDNLPQLAAINRDLESTSTANDIEGWLTDCTEQERAALLLPSYLGWTLRETARRLRTSLTDVMYMRRLATSKARLRAIGGRQK